MLSDINDYDHILVQFSGGKDSIMSVLKLIETGVDMSKVQLWHQCIDGKHAAPGYTPFMDWPSTEGYVRSFAKHFGLELVWGWRDGGFHKELFRENEKTAGVFFQREGDERATYLPTRKGELNTRRKFPAKTASLQTRWCSGTLKIDPHKRIINAISSFKGDNVEPKKILVITGERREESSARAKYDEFPVHSSNSKCRRVDHWRMIIDQNETAVWRMMEKYDILPHPAYFLGLPRLSCRSCIFFSPDHWATLKDIDPRAVGRLREIEEELGFTIDNKLTLMEMVALGKSRVTSENAKWVEYATTDWDRSIISSTWAKTWQLPAGAFGSGGGAL